MGLDAQLAAFGHGVAGVDGQVDQRAFQLVRVRERVHRRARLGRHDHHPHGIRQRAPQQVHRVVDQLGHIDRLRRQRLLSGEGQQAADQLGAAVRGLERRGQELGHVRVARVAVAQRGEVADHHGQHVVEVVRQPAGELHHGFHLLRLHDGGLRVLELRDVHREHEAAEHLAVRADLGHEFAAGVHGAAEQAGCGVFVADPLALQRHAHMRRHGGVDLGADHLGDRAAEHPVLAVAEPVGVALVDVAVDLVAVEVADHGRHRVGDQPQPLLAAAQRGGDLLVGLVGIAQLAVAGLQLGGALGDAAFQLGVLLADHALVAALGGDVGEQRDEAVVRQRLAAHRDDLAVRALAFGAVRLEGAGHAHPLGHQRLHVPRPVLAALGVVAHEALERRAHEGQVVRELQQLQQRLVPRHQPQVGVEHRDALVEQVEAGLQQLVALLFAQGIGGGVGGVHPGHSRRGSKARRQDANIRYIRSEVLQKSRPIIALQRLDHQPTRVRWRRRHASDCL